jgi:membrane protein required for colicin V production
MNVPYLDIVLLVIFAILTIRVIVRGFVAELLDMAALILAGLGAIFLSGPLSLLLNRIFGAGFWNQIIAFLACFVVIYFVIKIFERALHELFEKLRIENLDRALGLVLGLVEGFIVVSVLLIVLNWLKGIKLLHVDVLLGSSFIAKLLLPLLLPFAGPLGGQRVQDIVGKLLLYV